MRWISLFTLVFMPLSSTALVKMFGDSILADNTPIQRDLETLAPGVTIENFAKIGAGMRDGWVQSIPSIYAVNRDHVPSTILFDGGGNDVNAVRQECLAMTPNCNQTIDSVTFLIRNLIREMRIDGVRDIVYVGFYYIPGFRAAVDYAYGNIQSVCRASQRCHVVDLRTVNVELGWDGMHPVQSSYHDIANKIWDTMRSSNVSLV